MTKIFWAGDSTVKQNGADTYPQTGIGQEFHRFVKPLEVLVINHAENGRSTKSFLEEGRLEPITAEIGKGDFLFIQFGHNDEKSGDPTRYTDPETTFREYLNVFIDAALAHEAYPVLITPLTRRLFRDPTAQWQHDAYCEAMRAVGAARNVPVIELCAMSEKLVEEWGDERSRQLYMNLPAGDWTNYPDGQTDNTHLQPLGAFVFGSLIAKGLKELGGVYEALIYEKQTT